LAQEPVLIKKLQLELSRVSRKTIVQISYDATSAVSRSNPTASCDVNQSDIWNGRECYTGKCSNAGIGPISNLHGIGFGDNPIFTHSRTTNLRNWSRQCELAGILAVLSSVLYDCYDTQARTATDCTPDKKYTITIGLVGFVDDNNDHTNKFDQDKTELTWKEVWHNHARQSAQLWTDLLNASGGALELPKCPYHLVHWSFSISDSPELTIPTISQIW
jgi:hypothetical protein